jgi:hypothetical protein
MRLPGATKVEIERAKGDVCSMADDSVALEEPMELQIECSLENHRARKSIAVTMRPPEMTKNWQPDFSGLKE